MSVVYVRKIAKSATDDDIKAKIKDMANLDPEEATKTLMELYAERPDIQAALAAGIAAGRLYGGQVDIPVLIQDVVPSQKLYELAGGRAR